MYCPEIRYNFVFLFSELNQLIMIHKLNLLAIFITFCINTYAQEIEVKKVLLPEYYQSKIDEVYTKIDNWNGKLDVYYNPQSKNPTPVVLHIHGGGWNHGNKESQGGFNMYFNAGFAVVNVEYRLVQVAPAPAAIEDIRSAINYIKLNAKQLNLDPDKIVIQGGSAGAHLALMAGLLENDPIFDNNCKTKTDMKVAAIISNFAPSDLQVLLNKSTLSNSLTKWLADKYTNPKFVSTVSPITYIKKSSPPVFIVHGTADPIVPYNQSVVLQKKFAEAGVYNEFITVDGGGHGSFDKDKKIEIALAVMKFLKTTGLIN